MIRIGKYFLICSGITASFFLQSCSSSVETEKEEEKVRYEEIKPEKFVKNIDLAEREYISSSKISSIEKINFNLDSNGKPLKSEKLSTLNYNSKGFLTETIIYDTDGNVKYKFTYDYDNNGRRIKTTRFTDAKMTNYYTYDYNEFGNKTKAYRYDPAGNLEEYYIYKYDDEGNLIEEEWFSSSGGKVYSLKNDYDDGMKTHAYTYDENSDLIYEYVFRYDEKGNIIEEIKYDNNGLQAGVIQYIYKYY